MADIATGDTFAWHIAYDAEWTRHHLDSWFATGGAPNDWDRDTVDRFWTWLELEAVNYSHHASWSDLASAFDYTV